MGEANEALKSALTNHKLSAFLLSEIENQDMSETFKSTTSPSRNTLLHIAAAGSVHDHESMTTTLATKYPFMINMQNSKSDTPLHVAARAGMLETVKILVDCAKKSEMTSSSQIDVKSLLEMKNGRGNTALHEALNALLDAKKYKNKDKNERVTSLVSLARSLVLEDPNASYLKNVEDKSPLCLAVESDNEDILEYILKALPENDNCATNLEGKSPVKVAIELKNLGMLKMMHDMQPALLLIQDEQRNAPMHWAASVDHLEGVRFLYEINPDSVLQQNEEGFYPFHLASENGRVRVMGEFFEKENMPHPTELFNYKGQNILHVAAKEGRFDSVRRILKASNIDKLINETDGDGNTPLHLAALYGRHLAVASLILDRRAKSDIINNHGHTAYDIAEQLSAKINPEFSGNDDDEEDKKQKKCKCKSKLDMHNTAEAHITVDIYETTDKNMKDSESKPLVYNTMMTLSLLFIVYNYHQLFRSGGTFLRNLLKLIENLYRSSNQSPVNKKDVNNRITNLIVVAALIAGASFAAAVQMGSSSNSDGKAATCNTTASISIHGAGAVPFAPASSSGHGDGDESQKKKQEALPPFKVFTVFNTIAMYTSITAAIVLCWSQLLDTNLASIDVWAASLLIVIALYASCLAFFATIYMLNDTGEAFLVAITVIQGVFLLILLLRSFQLLVPFRLKKFFILFNYLVHLWIFYFLNWIWSSLKKTRCCARCLHGKMPKE